MKAKKIILSSGRKDFDIEFVDKAGVTVSRVSWRKSKKLTFDGTLEFSMNGGSMSPSDYPLEMYQTIGWKPQNTSKD